MKLLLLFILTSQISYGQDSFKVQGYHFQDEEHKIKFHPNIHLKKINPPVSDLLDTKTRDALFLKVNLDRELRSFDDIERDILIHKVKYSSESEIKSDYPGLPIDKLMKLKMLI